MTRENFYFLLDLPLDPPEENPSDIEKALKKKQAEWSRSRNHPTKGIQAQTNIGLVPTIREVMFNPDSRRKEAEKALEILKQKDAHKFDKVDHHVAILGAKGYITQDEIAKLAWFDNVDAAQLRERIEFPDQPPKKRKLRKPRVLDKDAKDKKASSAHELDKTVEGIIDDNLKQIGKASLYDFLGLSADSKLSELQRRARQKKTELSEVSKKDANLNASDTLAGQCMTIFKNARSRKAYDASRAKTHHAELNADIDVAGLDGFIRHEYFEHLVQTGVQFGMDPVQAADYIENYCFENNLALESAPRQIGKRTRIFIGVAAGVVLVLIVVFGVLSYLDSKENAKIIEENQKNAQRQQEFDQAVAKAEKLVASGNNEQAIALYEEFIQAYKGSGQSRAAVQKINAIKTTIENQYFQRIQKIGPLDQKLQAYLEHLKKFPSGRHVPEIKQKIAELKEPYYQFIMEKIQQYKQPDIEDWSACIELSQRFMKAYPEDDRNVDLNRDIEEYQEKKEIKQSFLETRQAIDQVDYHTAKKRYQDWLGTVFYKPYAETLKKRELEKTLKREKMASKEKARADIRRRLKAVSGRFRETKPGVVKDFRTGKMWTLLDSSIDYDYQNYGECLNYVNAQKYVQALTVGGFTDWRIPEKNELLNIYAKSPLFPRNETEWYWTNQTYPYFDEGLSSLVVDIVYPASERIFEKTPPTNAKFCGVVRAVRP